MKNCLQFGLIITLVCFGAVSCIPESKQKELKTVDVDLQDSMLYKIWAFGAQEETDSLVSYLKHRNPTYQWAALLPFASYVKEIPLEEISQLLHNDNIKVRTLAAYVLGQSHDLKAAPILINSFDNNDSIGQNTVFNAAILEAVGKTGNEQHALNLSAITTYLPSDSLLTLAQLRALYQMALRDIQPKEAMDLMKKRVSDKLYEPVARILAANYLARFHTGNLEEGQFAIIRTFQREKHPEIPLYLADVLPHCTAEQAKAVLIEALKTHNDYRVRLASAKALFKYRSGISTIMKEALSDQNHKVAATAAMYFVENGEENEAVNYRSWSQDEALHWETRYLLLGAALRNLPFYYQLTKTTLNGELKRLYIAEENPYRKAVILENMAWDPSNTDFIIQKYNEAQHPIIKTKAIKMMGRLLSNEKFQLILRGSATATERSILEQLKTVIEKGPNGPLCEAVLISNKYHNKVLKYWAQDTSVIRDRYNALALPAQLEAAQYLEQLMVTLDMSYDARDYHKDQYLAERSILEKITDSTLVEVETDKGVFYFKLEPETSPATVSNLVKLIQQGFYKDKTWHRIVPNFVAQTGCPDGDGYGSLNYTIRSEFAHHHYSGEGYIGMASAGPHTESTQWFVTYAATPHLDGRYTLFGKVTAGMASLHQLEVGDRILNMKIINQ